MCTFQKKVEIILDTSGSKHLDTSSKERWRSCRRDTFQTKGASFRTTLPLRYICRKSFFELGVVQMLVNYLIQHSRYKRTYRVHKMHKVSEKKMLRVSLIHCTGLSIAHS